MLLANCKGDMGIWNRVFDLVGGKVGREKMAEVMNRD